MQTQGVETREEERFLAPDDPAGVRTSVAVPAALWAPGSLHGPRALPLPLRLRPLGSLSLGPLLCRLASSCPR